MSRTDPKLVSPAGESAKAKLKNLATKTDKPFDPVAQRFLLEGAIRRIFQSDHADRFGLGVSLKGGALMFLAEGVDAIHGRGTTDIDLQISEWRGTMDELAVAMREALSSIPAIDDGVRFDVDDLRVTSIREGGVPGGAVTCWAQIGTMRVRFKTDVGFYDAALQDTLIETDYPSMLDLPPIRIWRQQIEYSISDKAHAAWKRGSDNSRLRDYYDLAVYLSKCSVDDDRLRQAFSRSWPLYGAQVPTSIDEIEGYDAGWAEEKAADFEKLRAASKWAVPVPDLPEIVALIRGRLGPVLQRLADEPEKTDASHLRDAASAGGFRPTLQ